MYRIWEVRYGNSRIGYSFVFALFEHGVSSGLPSGGRHSVIWPQEWVTVCLYTQLGYSSRYTEKPLH